MDSSGTDIVGPLPRSKSKNQYMLVFVDMFIKWVEIIPIKNKVATTIGIYGGKLPQKKLRLYKKITKWVKLKQKILKKYTCHAIIK